MDILSTIFKQQSRSIGIVIPSVVVSEKHSDTLEITEHPVEVGAAITDHAYKRPSEVVMEVGFAGGGSVLDLFDTSAIGLSVGKSPSEVYEDLLGMQRDCKLLDVITGKKKYSNMLIRAIEVTTDRTKENVLSAVITLREVIITSATQVNVANKADMKEGVSTSGTEDTGVKVPTPVNESTLSRIGGAISGFIGGGSGS